MGVEHAQGSSTTHLYPANIGTVGHGPEVREGMVWWWEEGGNLFWNSRSSSFYYPVILCVSYRNVFVTASLAVGT